ncbi:hypothetical protein GCM10009602_13970 [Nocardiopsis tropica]
MVEHLLEVGVPDQAGDAGQDLFITAPEPQQVSDLEPFAAAVVDPDSGDGFSRGGDFWLP